MSVRRGLPVVLHEVPGSHLLSAFVSLFLGGESRHRAALLALPVLRNLHMLRDWFPARLALRLSHPERPITAASCSWCCSLERRFAFRRALPRRFYQGRYRVFPFENPGLFFGHAERVPPRGNLKYPSTFPQARSSVKCAETATRCGFWLSSSSFKIEADRRFSPTRSSRRRRRRVADPTAVDRAGGAGCARTSPISRTGRVATAGARFEQTGAWPVEGVAGRDGAWRWRKRNG